MAKAKSRKKRKPKKKSDKGLNSTVQAADILGVDTPKVRALIAAGELVGINVATNPDGERVRWRVCPDSIRRFIERRSTAPRPTPAPKRRRAPGGVTEFF